MKLINYNNIINYTFVISTGHTEIWLLPLPDSHVDIIILDLKWFPQTLKFLLKKHLIIFTYHSWIDQYDTK